MERRTVCSDTIDQGSDSTNIGVGQFLLKNPASPGCGASEFNQYPMTELIQRMAVIRMSKDGVCR